MRRRSQTSLCQTKSREEKPAICKPKEASEETCLAAILILEFTASRPVGCLPGHFGLLFGSLGRLIQLWSVSLSFPWVLATALPSGSAVS